MGTKSSKTEDSAVKRIMVVGASGVGKSSLVNLLIGARKADVSDSANACTFSCYDYSTTYNGMSYIISDTVGLCGANTGTIPHKQALKELVTFTRKHQIGFNAFIFVMRKGRIMLSLEQTYMLFFTTMFEGNVPAIIYIAGCEQDEPMDKWGKENAKAFSTYAFKEIVCGTTQRNDTQLEHIWKLKREQTLQNIWAAIERYQLDKPCSICMKLTLWQRLVNIISKFFTNQEYFPISGTSNKSLLEKYLNEMDIDQASRKEIIDVIIA